MTSTDAVVTPAERLPTLTRQAILDAAFQLLRDEPGVPFSHEAVATRAGVAARTVYRHFAAQSDLTLALWERIRDTTGTRWPQAEAEILPRLAQTFGQFAAHETLTRAVVAAASTAPVAVHGSSEGRAAFRRSLADLLARLDDDDGAQLVAGCLAIYSAPFWLMLRDRGHLTSDGAIAAAATAMDALLAAAHQRASARSTDTTTT